jgi:exodeoxyribonuclease VII large subunit
MVDKSVTDNKIYTVRELTLSIKNNLEKIYPFTSVRGEVTNFYYHNRRHMYFDLKDEYSKIRVVMFNEANRDLGFKVEDGQKVIVTGYVSVYMQRGEYQVIALYLTKEGRGELIEAFEKLKAKLAGQGCFDISVKKKIPVLPGRIGLVTSRGGAVIKDIISVLERRFPNYHLILRNVNVQGITSSDQVIEAIGDLVEYGVDVIIIARGGGSFEDLWAFNEEKLALEIFGCHIPVISAIGHETDFTICDFVSDVRAATPSVSAELVIINKQDYCDKINNLKQKIFELTKSKNATIRKDLRYLLSRKVFKSPAQLLNRYIQDLDNMQVLLHNSYKDLINMRSSGYIKTAARLDGRKICATIVKDKIILSNLLYLLKENTKKVLDDRKNKVNSLISGIESLSPLKIMEKGYAIISEIKSDRLIKSIEKAKIGEDIKIIMRDGMLFAKVYDKIKKNNKEKN